MAWTTRLGDAFKRLSPWADWTPVLASQANSFTRNDEYLRALKICYLRGNSSGVAGQASDGGLIIECVNFIEGEGSKTLFQPSVSYLNTNIGDDKYGLMYRNCFVDGFVKMFDSSLAESRMPGQANENDLDQRGGDASIQNFIGTFYTSSGLAGAHYRFRAVPMLEGYPIINLYFYVDPISGALIAAWTDAGEHPTGIAFCVTFTFGPKCEGE